MPEYVFQNLEDENLPITTFSYEGEHYALPQNASIDIPEELADHLNSLTYPKYLKTNDALTGEEKAIAIPGKRRFSCSPVSKKAKAKSQ